MLIRPALIGLSCLCATSAMAQSRQAECERRARDYAAVVAPRTGASTLRNTANGFATNPQMGTPRSSTNAQSEWSMMQPNQNAYRSAYDDCMRGM